MQIIFTTSFRPLILLYKLKSHYSQEYYWQTWHYLSLQLTSEYLGYTDNQSWLNLFKLLTDQPLFKLLTDQTDQTLLKLLTYWTLIDWLVINEANSPDIIWVIDWQDII